MAHAGPHGVGAPPSGVQKKPRGHHAHSRSVVLVHARTSYRGHGGAHGVTTRLPLQKTAPCGHGRHRESTVALHDQRNSSPRHAGSEHPAHAETRDALL